MSFRNHLSADKDVDFTFSKSSKNALVIANVPHRIAIQPADPRFWKELPDLGFKPFRALPDVMDVLTIAFRTSAGWATS